MVFELAHRRRRRTARRRDALAQHGRVLAGLAQHLRRADHRLGDQLGGRRARQPEVHAGLDHRLDDKEQVRRPRARDRRDGVLLLLGHPDDPAGRAQQVLGLDQVRLVAVGAAGDRGHPLVDERRRVGHHADDSDAVR